MSEDLLKQLEEILPEEKRDTDKMVCPVCGINCINKGGFGCFHKKDMFYMEAGFNKCREQALSSLPKMLEVVKKEIKKLEKTGITSIAKTSGTYQLYSYNEAIDDVLKLFE